MIGELIGFLEAVPFLFVTWGTLVLFGGAIFLFSAWKISGRRDPIALLAFCFPARIYLSRSAFMDLLLYGTQKVLKKIEKATVLIAVATAIRTVLDAFPGEPATRSTGPSLGVTLLAMVVYFLVKEFGDWYTHYLAHKVPAFWELHKVHHAATTLNPLTSLRTHPLEVILIDSARMAIPAIPLGIACYLYDFNLLVLLGYCGLMNKAVTMLTLDPLRHSHLPVSLGALDRIFVSPHMHQIHHSKTEEHWDKNFATNLSIFDWIFGTAYRPSKGEEPDFGIGSAQEDAHYSTFRGAFFTPLARFAKIVVRKDPGEVPSGRENSREPARDLA